VVQLFKTDLHIPISSRALSLLSMSDSIQNRLYFIKAGDLRLLMTRYFYWWFNVYPANSPWLWSVLDKKICLLKCKTICHLQRAFTCNLDTYNLAQCDNIPELRRNARMSERFRRVQSVRLTISLWFGDPCRC